MSFQSDALNAVIGILEPLSQARDSSKGLLAGIPASLLEEAILWTPGQAHIRRRPGFPSWSWTGWIGEINEAKITYTRSPDPDSLTSKCGFEWVHVRNHPATDYDCLATQAGMTERMIAQFRSPGTVARPLYKLVDCKKMARVGWSLPRGVHNVSRQDLIWFWTVAFRLQLTTRVKVRDENDFIVELANSQGTFAGRVLAHWTGYPEAKIPPQDEIEFIVMRSTAYPVTFSRLLEDGLLDRLQLSLYYRSEWRDSSENPKRPGGEAVDPPDMGDRFYALENPSMARWFYVLLVRWQEDGVAERIGIGMVLETSIRDSLSPGPVWKEVFLS